MTPRTRSLFAVLLCAFLYTGSDCAQALTTPQWSRSLSTTQPTNESTLDWLAAADGETIVATAYLSDIVVRRVQPNGSYRYVQVLRPDSLPLWLSGAATVAMAADASSGDTLLLIGEKNASLPESCNLVQLDADGRRIRMSGVPRLSTDDGACLELAPLPDGSTVVLRERALVRLDSNGHLSWHLPLWPEVRAGFGKMLLLDAQQRLVVAGGEAEPTVHRFNLEGGLVSTHALLQPALPGVIGGLDLLANGDIVVAGHMDPAGNATHTGFVARLGASGQAQLLHTASTDVAYTYSTHDDAGLLYLQSGDGTVQAISAADGQLLWQRDGRSVAALAAGAVLVQAEPGWRATAVSPQNVSLWSTTIPHAIDRAEVRAGNSSGIRLVADITTATADCGPSPALLVLAPSDGSITGNQRICTIEASTSVRRLAALPQAGSLVQFSEEIRALSDSGAERWRFNARALGGEEARSRVLAATPLPDGGAWVLTARTSPPPIQPVLRRLAADGSLLQRWNVPVPPGYAAGAAAIVAEANEAALLLGFPGKLRWVRFTQPGDLREIRDYELAAASGGLGFYMSFPVQPRRLASGDIVLGYSWLPECGFLCPPRYTPLALMRLGRDGSERWRHLELGWYWPFAGFNSDGSAIAASQTGTINLGEIQRIDANGVAAPRQLLGMPISSIVGPSQDRYLLTSNGTHHALDASGNLTATGLTLGAGALGASDAGFLIVPDSGDTDALLIDPQSYAVSARFDFDGNPGQQQDIYTSHWTLGDDGSVYVASQRPSETMTQSGVRSYLTRFAVPGSAAGDIVFVDAFE